MNDLNSAFSKLFIEKLKANSIPIDSIIDGKGGFISNYQGIIIAVAFTVNSIFITKEGIRHVYQIDYADPTIADNCIKTILQLSNG